MSIEERIYCLVKDGKYYNHDHRYFTSQLYLATYFSSELKAKQFDNGFRLDCEVISVTVEEYQIDLAQMTTRAIIKAESLTNDLKTIKNTLPTVKGITSKLSFSLEKAINSLKIFQPYFKEFLTVKEDETDDVSGYYDEFMHEVSQVELYYCHEVSAILQAYKKDRKSILGIVNKINKYV